MNQGLSEPGVGVSALLLNMSIFFMMVEKGIISPNEAHDVIDTASGILKADLGLEKTLPKESAESALGIIESIRNSLNA